MKIQIEDWVAHELLDDIMDEIVRHKMRDIFNDRTDWSHPDDKKYYKKAKKAARLIHNYYSIPDEQL